MAGASLRLFSPRPGLRLGAILLTAAVAACGGGGVDTTPLAAPSSQSVTLSTTSNTTVPPAGAGGVTAAVVLPPASVAASITESVSVHTFGSTPVLSSSRAAGQSASRSPLAATAPFPVLYVQLLTSETVTLNGTPGISFTLPSIPAGTTYFLAQYNGTNWVYPEGSAGTVSGTTVSFPVSTSGSLTFTAAAPVEVALYAITGPALTPATLTLDAGNPTSAPFTVAEPGDTAAFTAAITCAAATPPATPSPSASPVPTATPTAGAAYVAQLAATSATPVNGVATFTVDSGSMPGACSVIVTDAQSASSTETVNVDASAIGIYSTNRAAAQGVR